MIRLSLLIIALALVLAACSDASIVTVGPDGFAEALDDPDAFVIQTHTPYYAHIEGTDLIAERWQYLSSYDLPEDKSRPILVYCRSGHMSAIAAQELIDLGYSNVMDLEGGMNAWTASGRELIVR